MAYLVSIWLTILAVSRVTWAEFIWPATNLTVEIGSFQTLEWRYEYFPYKLTLFQGPDANGDFAFDELRADMNEAAATSYSFPVNPLEGRPPDQCFHARLESSDPEAGDGLDSPEFCAVEAAASAPNATVTATATPTNTSASQDSSDYVALGVGLGLGIPFVLLLGIGLGIFLYRRRKRREGKRRNAVPRDESHTLDAQGPVPAYVDVMELDGRGAVFEKLPDRNADKVELPVEEERQELPVEK